MCDATPAGRILGSYLRDSESSKSRHSEISPRTGSENNLSSAFCLAYVMTHVFGFFYIFVGRDAIAEFIGFFYFSSGTPTVLPMGINDESMDPKIFPSLFFSLVFTT